MSVNGSARDVSSDGLANLAHALRRSTALYVAMTICPPTSSVDDMLRTADKLAIWIRGQAGAAHAQTQDVPPLGEPFNP